MSRSLALIAVLAATPLHAQTVLADLAEIDRAVVQFTGKPQGAPGGAALPVDRRLRLSVCRVPLALDWYGARRDTVQVSCPMPGGWKLYVPLAGGGGQAPAAAPVIARGDAISVMVSGDGFAVSQPGEALESGAEGAWIKVRTLAPGAPALRARVIRPGLVGIDLP
ncbi:MAG TPA: flagella basal body P-ring formation protein FlgA [Novosphingobium sp.]|nr:flagella basal body P-ring formation protein FlgA [Novosphingobium sp.]HQA17803.1 flagella basal body P-ring formation protein FlgA [Novosphingobium sp.]